MGKYYDQMMVIQQEVGDIHGVLALMGWDQEVYMPRKGAATRGRQLATLSGMAHTRFISEEMGHAIERAGSEELTLDQQVNLREISWSHKRAGKLPTSLVKALAETSSAAIEVWMQARADNDFPSFAPWVEKLVKLQKESAEAIGYENEAYDALLEEYEPGASTQDISDVFEALRGPTVDLVQRIRNSEVKPRTDFLKKTYPVEDQRRFGVMVSKQMGFDYEAGRLDISPHPFCTHMGVQDVRLTTRYSEDLPAQSLYGIIHETGHGLYEQGQDVNHEGTPRGQSVSLGIHESQSRMWENMVCRSRAFWRYFYPKFVETFPDSMQGVTEEELYAAVNEVTPSLIRVEADEVTYNLHILLRFEIERGLFADVYTVDDLPDIWHAKMKEYFGIEPPDDRSGVLQDIHWSHGGFGYFPTYTLGNLYGAQFYDTAKQALPDLTEQIAHGELLPLREWLRENIHQLGMAYRPKDLVKQVTGKALSADYFLAYMEEKFGALYEV